MNDVRLQTMYVGAHCYRIEGLPLEEGEHTVAYFASSQEVDKLWYYPTGQAIIDDLLKFSSQPKYVYSASWKQPGDLIMWDNTA